MPYTKKRKPVARLLSGHESEGPSTDTTDPTLATTPDRSKPFSDVANLNEWTIHRTHGVLTLSSSRKCLALKTADEHPVWVCHYPVSDICITDDWSILVTAWVDEPQPKRRAVFRRSEGVWQSAWMDSESESDLDVRDQTREYSKHVQGGTRRDNHDNTWTFDTGQTVSYKDGMLSFPSGTQFSMEMGAAGPKLLFKGERQRLAVSPRNEPFMLELYAADGIRSHELYLRDEARAVDFFDESLYVEERNTARLAAYQPFRGDM